MRTENCAEGRSQTAEHPLPDRCAGSGAERRPVRPAYPAQAGKSPVSRRAPFADVELILSEEDSDWACIVDVGDTGRSYVIPWSSILQELQQPLRRYVAQADGKLCGYCNEELYNTENGRMIVEL